MHGAYNELRTNQEKNIFMAHRHGRAAGRSQEYDTIRAAANAPTY